MAEHGRTIILDMVIEPDAAIGPAQDNLFGRWLAFKRSAGVRFVVLEGVMGSGRARHAAAKSISN
jgi:hypothetical protein